MDLGIFTRIGGSTVTADSLGAALKVEPDRLSRLLYALASIVLPFSGWIAPNALGVAVILAQAVAVGVFAELQYMGLRRRSELAVS